jgi:hypothetical protein
MERWGWSSWCIWTEARIPAKARSSEAAKKRRREEEKKRRGRKDSSSLPLRFFAALHETQKGSIECH